MLHERVAEALHHVVAELLQLFLREVERREEFLEHDLLHERAHFGILAAFLHGIQAAQVAHRRKHGVRTVQKGHLPLMVRSLGRDEEHVEAGLVGRELGGDLLRGLDDPEMEDLGLVQQMVVIAGTLAQLRGGITRITRDDAVHEGAVHTARVLEPVPETFPEVPQVDVLADALLQVLAVLEDQLAREDDEALVHRSIEVLVAVIEELGELARIGGSRRIVQLAGRIEGDARLGGVGDDEAHFRLLGELQVGLEVLVGIDAPADDVDQVHAVHGLSVLEALEVQVIEAVLLVEPADHALLDRLDDDHGGVEIGFLVGLPDNPLDKRAEEVAFTELDDLFGVLFRLRGGSSV